MKLPNGYVLTGEEIVVREEKGDIVRSMPSKAGCAVETHWSFSANGKMNEEVDDGACQELIHQGHTISLTTTPSLWIRRTHAVGMYVKQGKGGGVSACPEIAADFHLWLDPKKRLAIVRKHM